MNCHSVLFANTSFLEPVHASFRDNRPLRIRAHDLTDFVYFNHSIHTASIFRSTARRVIGE